jgi:acyl-CoA thioesterase I
MSVDPAAVRYGRNAPVSLLRWPAIVLILSDYLWANLILGENMHRYIHGWMKTVFYAGILLVAQATCAPFSYAQVVALGASNVQGYGVSSGEAFPSQLEAMLRAKGKNYSVANQGIYGDTTSGVLSRLDSAVPQGTRIVILLIGGNDVRRGATTEQAKAGANEIVARLKARNIRVISAAPYYRAARAKGMVLPDGIHLSAAGQRYLASQLSPLIN